MKYVMSDIHGNFDKYIEMLKLINFNEEDELYILGDIFDRGDKSLEILEHIQRNKNIFLIKGNHEAMYEECYEDEFRDVYSWFCNGGNITFEHIINKGHLYMDSLYKYIKRLPYIRVVDKFILVHAGLYLPSNLDELTLQELLELQEEDNCIWTRANIDKERKFKEYAIISGHSSVQGITKSHENKILHRDGHIYIDCGLQTMRDNTGKLACIRLDDMEEFYVSKGDSYE
ncbi:MAG: metallophosphoesterase [Cetobacterium sp.]